jgi:hypothetical protein
MIPLPPPAFHHIAIEADGGFTDREARELYEMRRRQNPAIPAWDTLSADEKRAWFIAVDPNRRF